MTEPRLVECDNCGPIVLFSETIFDHAVKCNAVVRDPQYVRPVRPEDYKEFPKR